MKLSILIPTLPQHAPHLAKVMQQVREQLGVQTGARDLRKPGYTLHWDVFGDVEVITCLDNKRLKVGHKRNILKVNATGQYMAYIDDDDVIATDYFARLLPHCNGANDLVTFRAVMHYNGKPFVNVDYDLKHLTDHDVPGKSYKPVNGHRRVELGWANRVPNHLMVWRTSIARNVDFPNINFGEDGIWAQKMRRKVKTVQKLENVLYHYMFDSRNTETQKRTQ
jgi:glycosyltransferase involved in cell wall biosynthesis